MLLTELVDALQTGGPVFLPDNFARTLYPRNLSPAACWEAIRLSPFHQGSLAVLRQTAASYGDTPAEALPLSLYRLFDETGERIRYEDAYFSHRARLNAFALLAMGGDEQAVGRLEDAIWAICDEYSWCLPAHLGGRSLLPEAISGGVGGKEPIEGFAGTSHSQEDSTPYRSHDREVDLFAAETASALSEICALLKDRLSPVVVSRARARVFERVLDSVCSPGPAFVWETLANNWSAVCAGAVGIAAMYLIPDARTLAPILQRCLQAMEVFLSGFADDGACTEGLGYWNYGFGYYVCFAERLSVRTGGRVDLLAGEKVREIARFQQRVWLGGNRVVSFSDGARQGRWHPGLTHWLAHRFSGMEVPDARHVERFGDDRCHRWVMDVRDFLWADPACARPKPGETGSVWFSDAAWLISRASSTAGPAVFAAKGGHNDEPHNHNDIGHFLLHAGGETYLDDTGAGEYTKAYFGPGRYEYLVNNSSGHSVPQLGTCGQQAGKSFHADVIQIAREERRDVLALDLTAAYGIPSLRSLTRTFLWDRDVMVSAESEENPSAPNNPTGQMAGPILTVEDRFVQEETIHPIVERFVTCLTPEIHDMEVWIRGASGCLRICPDAPGFMPSLRKQTYRGHHGEPLDLWQIAYTHPTPQGDCQFRARFGWVQ